MYTIIKDEEDFETENTEPNLEPISKVIDKEKIAYVNDLKEAGLKCGCVLYFVVGVTLFIAVIGKEMDLDQNSGLDFSEIFSYLMMIFYVMNILIICLNRYVIFSTTSSRTTFEFKKIKNNWILCVTLPIIVISIIYFILQLIVVFKLLGDDLIMKLTFIKILFFIFVFILIMDITNSEINEKCHPFLTIKKASIIITNIGLVLSVTANLSRYFVHVFKELFMDYYNITYNSSTIISYTNNTSIINVVLTHMSPIYITCVAICMSSLLASLLGYSTERKDRRNLLLNVKERKKWKGLLFPLIIGVLVVLVSIGIIISTYIIKMNNKITINRISSTIVESGLYIIGIIVSVIQINEIKNWTKTDGKKEIIFNKFLIMVGGFGQIVLITKNVSIAIEEILENNNDFLKNLSQYLLFVNMLFLCIQIGLQNIIVHLALLSIGRTPLQGSAVRKCCPSMILFGLNMGSLLLNIFMTPLINVPIMGKFSVDIFHLGLHIFGIAFSVIYRLHGCIFFGLLLHEIYE